MCGQGYSTPTEEGREENRGQVLGQDAANQGADSFGSISWVQAVSSGGFQKRRIQRRKETLGLKYSLRRQRIKADISCGLHHHLALEHTSRSLHEC